MSLSLVAPPPGVEVTVSSTLPLVTDHLLARFLLPLIPHASTEPELPTINCVSIRRENGVLIGVATDRYSLLETAFRQAEPGTPDIPMMLIPLDDLAPVAIGLRAALRRKEARAARLEFDLTRRSLWLGLWGADNQWTLAHGRDGEFPKYLSLFDSQQSASTAGEPRENRWHFNAEYVGRFAGIAEHGAVEMTAGPTKSRPYLVTAMKPAHPEVGARGLLMPVREGQS